MNSKLVFLPLALMMALPIFGEDVFFADDFKNADAISKNWTHQKPTAPADGVLVVTRNQHNPSMVKAFADKDNLTFSGEFSFSDSKGFAGMDLDGIKFVIRGNSAVAIFKSPLKDYMDSRLCKIDGIGPDTFVKLTVNRTSDGEDYRYQFSANGTLVCTLEKQKIPATHKLSLVKSQTDMKVRNFSVIEGASNE